MDMSNEIRARYSKGKIEPLEDLNLQEGEEVVNSIKKSRFSENTWKQLKGYAEQKSKEAGITSEKQVNELVHDQRRRKSG